MCLKKWYRILAAVITVGFVVQSNAGMYVEAAEDRPTVVNAETAEGCVVGAVTTTNIYTKPNQNSEVLNVVIQNQVVRSLGEENGYYKLKYGNGNGYVSQKDFVKGDQLVAYIRENPEWYVQSVVVTAENTNLLDWLDGSVSGVATAGDSFQLKETEKSFYVAIRNIESVDGKIDSELVRIPKTDASVKYLLSVTSFEGLYMVDTLFSDLISYACQFVGYPYVWGGTDPLTGADCSGFIQYVYRQFGIELPRCSWQQAEVGNRVPLDKLEPGDLIFYQRGEKIGHVALYIGDGKVVQARGQNYGICVTEYDYSVPAWANRVR